MDITDVRVFPVDEEKLKAYVTIVFDRCFMVSDIKVINGQSGLFISMPSKRRKNGTFRDVAHPLNSETRRMIEETVLSKYEEVLATASTPAKIRGPREAEEAGRTSEEDRDAAAVPESAPERGRRPGVSGI